ncbi:MAG: hypothetical protein IJ604_02455 [Prevotella sp.]|nr:hypothetical protein [Prevotella sp.]
MGDTTFYNEKTNLLLGRIMGDNKIEYIFIHFGDDKEIGFVAYFDSYDSDTPIVFTLKSIKNDQIIKSLIERCFNHALKKKDDSESCKTSRINEWKTIRIKGFLPSDWCDFFVQLEETLMKND